VNSNLREKICTLSRNIGENGSEKLRRSLPLLYRKILLSSSTIPKNYSCSINPYILSFTRENYYYLILWYIQKNMHTSPTTVYYTAFFYSIIGKIYLLHCLLPIYCIILRYLTLVKMGLKKLRSLLSLLYRKNTIGKI
jgi:hypothetical protein